MPTSGPDESQFNRILNAHRLFSSAQTNEPDAVIDALGAVSMANVQGYSLPFHIKQQPIQTKLSQLVPGSKQITAYPRVTCRTSFSAQPILLKFGVVYTLVMQETLWVDLVTAQMVEHWPSTS